jgi:hypothetical protein
MAHYDGDDDFETTDAGAALTIPIRAGELRQGALVVMKGVHPCKVCVWNPQGVTRRAFWPLARVLLAHTVISVG